MSSPPEKVNYKINEKVVIFGGLLGSYDTCKESSEWGKSMSLMLIGRKQSQSYQFSALLFIKLIRGAN